MKRYHCWHYCPFLSDVCFIELAIVQLQEEKCDVAGKEKQDCVEQYRPSVPFLALTTQSVPREQTNHASNRPNKKHEEQNDVQRRFSDARLQNES